MAALVDGVYAQLVDFIKPGIKENEIDALGLQVEHGVGLSNHEKPIITRAVSLAMPAPVEAGMHFALETFAGDGDDGARIESQVVVTEKGHEVITKWPCDELMVHAAR
jgi:Xaa-Pro dipeptidase